MFLILLVILILLMVGAFPRWNYNSEWGYGPLTFLLTVLLILVILRLAGYVV